MRQAVADEVLSAYVSASGAGAATPAPPGGP